MNCISYSLFGTQANRHPDSFSFNSYLRGLFLSIRMNRIIFPNWENVVHVAESTYRENIDLFTRLNELINVRIVQCADAPICKAMLWRMKPVFEISPAGWRYQRVLCRDLDSPTMYKDAQCVQQWVNNNKAAHAITDSVSHTIPMMGGMIGFWPAAFRDVTGIQDWNQMFNGVGLDFSRKGTDQDFLNRYIYPFLSEPGRDSITQHYLLGMPNTWLSDFHSRVPDQPVLWLTDAERESNDVAGHIGAAGYYEGPMFRFLWKYKDKFKDLEAIEATQKETFIWPI